MTIFYENVYATQAFCYLLDFVYQHNQNLTNKLSEPIFENNSNRLILANHSLKQLNIIGDNNFTGKYSSVSKMLNVCITSIGKREFNHNFLNPTTDKNILNEEYNIIEYLLQNKDRYNLIKSFLSSVDDLSRINRQMILGKSTPKMIYRLYTGIVTSQSMYENLIINDPTICSYLGNKICNFQDIVKSFSSILQYIRDKFIIEECKNIDNLKKIETNFIHNGVNQELDDQMELLIENQDKLECCRLYFNSLLHNDEISNSSKKKSVKSKKKNEEPEEPEEESEEIDQKNYIKIHITEKNNIGLIATSKRCKTLEGLIKNKKTNLSINLTYTSTYFKCEKIFTLETEELQFNHQSASNKFITNRQIENICYALSNVKIQIMDTMAKVFEKIVKDMDVYSDKIEQICNFIKYIDLSYAKMFIADKFNYCRPVIVDECDKSFINVCGLRHCLIEKIQQNELYVTNDLVIGTGEMNGMLLYGTNAVGKTSFIRALGMAILKRNNKNCLVLGDELCSGTESTSATSIFVSGIQHLNKTNCSFIFATHLHEILEYDEIINLENVHIKHMSVIYNKESGCLEYDRKLKDGAGNNMYGLEVCKSLNLPEEFLENAHNIRMKYHPESASILDRRKSHFNAKKIVGNCEMCGNNMASEVHHLQYQREANKDGIISRNDLIFHKNHKANLLNICEQCHQKIHKENKQYKKVKTTKGMSLKEI